MYVVSNAVELQEVVTLPYTKTIYVNGTIQGNQFPNASLSQVMTDAPWTVSWSRGGSCDIDWQRVSWLRATLEGPVDDLEYVLSKAEQVR